MRPLASETCEILTSDSRKASEVENDGSDPPRIVFGILQNIFLCRTPPHAHRTITAIDERTVSGNRASFAGTDKHCFDERLSNSPVGEFLAEVAVRNRERIFERARYVSAKNLALLDAMFREHEDAVAWVRPMGGFTGFPSLRDREDSRPFCEAASQRGVLLVPGDCFGVPAHFRVGFGACADEFDLAVEILGELLASKRSVLSR